MELGTPTIDQSAAQRMLLGVVCDVLDGFATVFAEPADDAIAFSSAERWTGRSCFYGEAMGVVTLSAPEGLCAAMAPQVLRDVAGASDRAACGSVALGELAHAVANRVATSMGPLPHVWFSPPVVEQSTYHDWVVMGCASGTVRLNVEGWPLLASLTIAGA